MIVRAPKQYANWVIIPAFCRYLSAKVYVKKKNTKFMEFSKPNPTRNKPISTKTIFPASNISNNPKDPIPNEINSDSLLPIISTIEPNIIYPTKAPKKNIPIVIDIIFDF